MKIPIPRIYDQVMDLLATIFFPSRKHVTGTLALYIITAAIAATWFYGWVWGAAVLLCFAMAWMISEWF